MQLYEFRTNCKNYELRIVILQLLLCSDTGEYCRVLVLAGGCCAAPCSDLLDLPPLPNSWLATLTLPAEVLGPNGTLTIVFSQDLIDFKLVGQI